MTLKYAKLDQGVKTPVRKHPTDAGVDVFARERVEIPPFTARKVPTGLTFEIPEGFALLAWPKSGGDLVLGAGVIDAEYQGEVMIKVVNYMQEPLVIEQGAAVAQLLKVPVVCDPLEELALDEIHLSSTERGATGGINNG